MDFSLYKPTDLEKWINLRYKEAGIHYASDMDIDLIASIFSAEVMATKGPSSVHFNDSLCLIFLNGYLNERQKREVFFHELCHPLLHFGNQRKMPQAFMELQEIQAFHFQLYAAMPWYMVDEFIKDVPDGILMKVMAEEFRLSEAFVQKRLQQIQHRIWVAQMEQTHMKTITNVVITDDHVRNVIADLGRKRKERQGA
jgi:Zn-dependent peptidase ImmA (M78 family)